jgi:hypothetical protein
MRYRTGRRNAHLRLVALVFLAALVLPGSRGAARAPVPTASDVRLTPARLSFTTAAPTSTIKLASAMFDRDTTTEYRPTTRQRLLVDLPQPALVRYLKAYGNASYTVRLWSVIDDELNPLLILDTYDLRSVGSGWLRIPISDPVVTSKILVEVTPVGSSITRGVAEFELWSQSDDARDTANGADLLNRISQGMPTFEATLYTAVSAGSPPSSSSTTRSAGTGGLPTMGSTEAGLDDTDPPRARPRPRTGPISSRSRRIPGPSSAPTSSTT